MIQQRVNAGLARAGAQGKRLGRPKIDAKTEWAICQALATGQGILKTAAQFGVGSGTGPLGGGSMVERNLNRWTIFFAVLFFINAFVLLKRPWG